MTGSVFLYRAREHLFHVDVYLLLCFRQHFRQHFQPNTLIPDSLLERFARCLLCVLGLSDLSRLGGRVWKGSSVRGVIPGLLPSLVKHPGRPQDFFLPC